MTEEIAPMEPFRLNLFQSLVRDQCFAAGLAIAQANDALATTPTDHDRLWASVQSFLTASANVSKALWGQGGKLADQRASLRASLGVQDDSPLRNVDMRNHYEHFDERIDRWWNRDRDGRERVSVDQSIGDIRALGQWDPLDIFRFYDTTNGQLIFWGEQFDTGALIREIIWLRDAAVAALGESRIGEGATPLSGSAGGAVEEDPA